MISCSNPTDSASDSGPNTVIMENTSYNPETLTVEIGTTVTWENNDSYAHTVTSGSPGNPTDTFDSGNIEAGESYERTFNETGTFNSYCTLHPDNMTGTIEVQETVSSGANDGGSGSYGKRHVLF
ncbi:MAG: cupredoxin domain-containing protein [Candidatus Marinimicrobia bacterium]|nr:cupredoxin domain-containing protein [Candidatus Neomarinimicrobiota bacterium]MCF7830263.1 cupredoxin domain-containing protein [Candidatus Neomarinimicrobiota bacterium]MCF7882172.1 cupredoxin domain-containing protein [Candidatus Neomarinimicrobiota bacterium]